MHTDQKCGVLQALCVCVCECVIKGLFVTSSLLSLPSGKHNPEVQRLISLHAVAPAMEKKDIHLFTRIATASLIEF